MHPLSKKIHGITAQGSRARVLHPILLRYTQAVFAQLAQQSACNRSHNMEERCARWILMIQDRVGTDEFPLTQAFLAYMLGSRRASVTIAAGILANAGLIRYTRGSSMCWIEPDSKRQAVNVMASFNGNTNGSLGKSEAQTTQFWVHRSGMAYEWN
jgi:hypothetical protein